MATRTPGSSALFPGGQPRQLVHEYWGVYPSIADLPNGSGNVLTAPEFTLEQGDTAYVPGVGICQCDSAGTPGGSDAVWSAAGVVCAPQFEWNLNGSFDTFAPEPAGGFNGLPVTDPALSGPGPFDGTRVVTAAGTLVEYEIILRVPPAVLATTFVEFYRIRAGVVTSIALAGIASVAPNAFTAVSGVPAPADVAVGDLLFVALDGLGAPAGVADISLSLRMVPS